MTVTRRTLGLASLALLATLVVAGTVVADTRDVTRDDRAAVPVDDRRVTDTPLPPPPPPAPSSPDIPVPSQGGIESETSGVADSGGNTGGDVVTGDESVTVIEINIGPTTPSPEDEEDADEEVVGGGTPSCDGRTRVGCGVEGRTR